LFGMTITQIKETCIYSTDLAAMKSFYHDKLGLPVIGEAEGKHIFFKAGASVLLCFHPDDSRWKQSPPAHFATGKYHFAFEVPAETYEAHKAKIRSLGITITDEVQWKNNLRSFYFDDPAGNVVEIVPTGVWD
jgi:catechol-2,3-dioxygenase